MTTTTKGLQVAREQKERMRIKLMELEHARKSGALVDREQVERAIFARARLERDAWIAWVARAAPGNVAAELGTDERASYAVLERLVLRHLDELARVPLTVAPDAA